MEISHKIINVSGQDRIYIYVTVEDIYEFGKENFGNGKDTNFLKNIREYAKTNFKEFSKAAVVIVINGVTIGTLTLSALMPKYNENRTVNQNAGGVEIYEEQKDINIYNEEKADINKENTHEDNKEVEEKENIKKEDVVNKVVAGTATITATTNKNTNKTSSSTNKVTMSNSQSNTVNKTNTTTSNKVTSNTTTKPTTTTNNAKPTTSNTSINNTTTKTEEKTETTTKVETVTSGRTIRFNNNGVISNIDLEEYIIGVVAAEMPAAFNTEALKAQAVVARTYAMKKALAGITLVNSTSHQVYNSVSQMKAKWGSSFNTYYAKIKNAVTATKGQVLKYNGNYIEALYYAVSNGKSELPKYVWSSSEPYLQAVSSNWDKDISAGKYSITMTYAKLSQKLGVTVDINTEITVISTTEGDRVAEIKIGEKTFTGVKVRSLLGLRSADFEIVKTDVGVTITTHGFGHGVGMSQYGANGAAKEGYTYRKILNHYYPSAVLTTI